MHCFQDFHVLLCFVSLVSSHSIGIVMTSYPVLLSNMSAISRNRFKFAIRYVDRLESAGWGGCLRRQISLGQTRQFTRPASPAPSDVTLCAHGGLEAFMQCTQICQRVGEEGLKSTLQPILLSPSLVEYLQVNTITGIQVYQLEFLADCIILVRVVNLL